MLFLVWGECTEVGALLLAQQKPVLTEQAVLPSPEIWAEWVAEGRISGGMFTGERAGAFVIEANSAEEVGELLATLPIWGMIRWQVRPFQSVPSMLERERRIAEQTRRAAAQGAALAGA